MTDEHGQADGALRRRIRATLMPGFVGTELPDWLAVRLMEGLGAVCLFGQNIVSPGQLRRLTAAIRSANPLAVIAIDEEGGDVTRLYFSSGSPYPGNAILGRIDDLGYSEEVGRQVGWELRKAGCTLTFAPDTDVNSNPDNPVIGVRSFGADPAKVGRHAAAWVRGVQSTGIAACPKHFPGHGDTALDSHLAMPVVDVSLDTLQERELVPFRAAVAAGARTVMTSHILLPQVDPHHPATLSAAVLGGMLRTDLGFDGVIVSDALNMTGASGTIGIPAAAAAALAAVNERAATWLAAAPATFSVVRLDTASNIAVGGAPWGPFAEVAADPGSELAEAWRRKHLVARGSDDESELALPATAPVLVIGKDNHRHPFVRDLVDALRAERPDVIVVDMGWPSDDLAYADVATYGASRLAGRALLEWLTPPTPA